MNRQARGRGLAMGLAAVALAALLAGNAEAAGEARVQVYSLLDEPGAIDATAQLLAPRGGHAGQTIVLADDLAPFDEGALWVAVPAGRARIEARVPGAGLERRLRRTMRFRPDHAYCVVVNGYEGDRWLTQFDVTKAADRETTLAKVCADLAR